MSGRFSEEKSTLMMMGLMKAHGIRKVIVSPGTTNVALVASMQRDPYFELYSSVDERSAGYIACGLAEESGEPVALSCTQATASRNYLPALTEAYYRKLPVLAITSTQHLVRIGQNVQQAIDRSSHPVDTLRKSVHIPIIHDEDDSLYANIMINEALLELRRAGGGPVHIDLTTSYSRVFDVDEIPEVRVISRVSVDDVFPDIPHGSKVAVFVGNHSRWSDGLTNAIDSFCRAYGAPVFCDQTSNYWGDYRVNPSLLFSQGRYDSPALSADILIHIGDVSGASTRTNAKEVWRVNPDGEIRDTFRRLRYVFEMSEERFFSSYASHAIAESDQGYLRKCRDECSRISGKVPDLPFSNAWIARQTISQLPKDCILHLGIYNSLRTWSLVDPPHRIFGYSNTGGFGIDGGVSSLIGASLAREDPCFGVFGDLAFFYDLNSLGNRHVKGNLRILLVNNGCGVEFKEHINRAYSLGEEADPFIAACGHYGQQSEDLVRHYAEDLGFRYLSAKSKEEYLSNLAEFVSPEVQNRPILMEAFVSSEDDVQALKSLYEIEASRSGAAKAAIRSAVGEKGVRVLKKVLK